VAVKNKNMILAVAAGLAVLLLVFAWLFWGSTVPEPTDSTKKAADNTVKSAVHNTVLNRDEGGKKKWSLKAGVAFQESDGMITAKKLDGTIYFNNGDEMYVKADAGKIGDKQDQFELSGKVTARMKRGGFLKADKVEWDQKKDILTATGAVKVVKDDMLAQAEKIITSSKFNHFRLIEKAHVERGGRYEEK
jgi:LPS export ABC transporter protein LptC